MRMWWAAWVVVVSGSMVGCADARFASGDAGDDTGVGSDASPDSSQDAAIDASPDASPDATVDPDGGLPRPGAAGELVITEIMFDSDAITDDCGEWFELHNPSADTTYDLRGCTFADADNAYVVPVSLTIAPGQYLSLSRFLDSLPACQEDPADPLFDFDYYYGTTNPEMDVKFGNAIDDAEEVRVSCGGTTIDVVQYTSFAEGDELYLGALKGYSLSLDPDATDASDNDSASNWCPGAQSFRNYNGEHDFGSPGQANPDC